MSTGIPATILAKSMTATLPAPLRRRREARNEGLAGEAWNKGLTGSFTNEGFRPSKGIAVSANLPPTALLATAPPVVDVSSPPCLTVLIADRLNIKTAARAAASPHGLNRRLD